MSVCLKDILVMQSLYSDLLDLPSMKRGGTHTHPYSARYKHGVLTD